MKNMNLKKVMKIADGKMPSKYKVKDENQIGWLKGKSNSVLHLQGVTGNVTSLKYEQTIPFEGGYGDVYTEDVDGKGWLKSYMVYNNQLYREAASAKQVDWIKETGFSKWWVDNNISDSKRKVKDGFSNNPNYFGDWYGEGQIDFSAIINPEDDGDVYMVKLWCGSGYILDVYLCKAHDIYEAMDIVFDWSYKNEGENEMVFDYNYLHHECIEDYYYDYGLKPNDLGEDYDSGIDELCDEINRLMDKADEDTMNGNLSNGFVVADRNDNISDEAEKLFNENLYSGWNFNVLKTDEQEGHYPIKSWLLTKDEGECEGLLLKTRVTQYGQNVIECRVINDKDLSEFGVDFEEYEQKFFDYNYVMAENGLYARDENFFVDRVPDEYLENAEKTDNEE